MAGYRDLKAWQFAVAIADDVYKLTDSWPPHERYGLTSQTCRSAVSVSANIAEGQGRLGQKEFRHHLSIAYGSLCELETLVHIATRRGYCSTDNEAELIAKTDETARVIRGLIKSLET